ncbi:MAG: hypothetical protein ACI4NJ_08425 [Cellvibrio sp.]
MNLKSKSLIVGFGLGAIIYHIAWFFIGYTAAITLPGPIYNWAKENSAHAPVIFVWDLFVVQLFGIGILAGISTYLVLRLTSLKWLYVAAGFLVSDIILSFAYLLTLPTLEYFSEFNLVMFLPHFIVVSICVFYAANVGSKYQKV